LSKHIVILGAGKVGRGFIADIFYDNGYNITFIDSNRKLIDEMNHKGRYDILNLPHGAPPQRKTIHHFVALHIDEKERIGEALSGTTLLAIALFQNAFDKAASCLSGIPGILKKSKSPAKLDIILCTNILGASEVFKNILFEKIGSRDHSFVDTHVGFVDSLIMRIVTTPTGYEGDADSLSLVTNAYPDLVLDSIAFKGRLPEGRNLIFTRNIHADEMRKMFTYNMVHAVFAYGGVRKNYSWLNECTSDAGLYELARLSLEETSEGLKAEFGYTDEEMKAWNKACLKHMTNPVLQDPIERVAADPTRKLSRDERLTGPALLCRRHGVLPWYMAITMANALCYSHAADEDSKRMQHTIRRRGIRGAIEEICGIEQEKELTALVVKIYEKDLHRIPVTGQQEIALYKKAWSLGFSSEKAIRGCAQCTLKALFELTGVKDSNLFSAASGFSGGMAIVGDGVCGGYSGGVLFMGMLMGRRLEFADADKDRQYKSYDMAQKLHDRFIETYGSITCSEIHRKIFGKAYILKTKAVRDEFERAGAHIDKCTSVIGQATMWVTELLKEEGLI
jgi:mannitol-1-phosphate 5-dehydrogenase